ncbi:MAG: helix-turn-helix domain-containing protein [Chloroflexi bacterium]|nr:MAG: helix-turn-helix domain-containing protein [Chloroflexota bacterium]
MATRPPEGPGIKPAYTIAEVARLLDVHPGTVNRFIRRGELRVSRLGHRTIRVTYEALMDFLRAHEEAR